MKKTISCICSFALLALVGCNSEQVEQPVGEGYGYVNFACEASPELLTRAEAITVPMANEFSLHIVGLEYDQQWDQFADFVSADNRLAIGEYTASVAWGDMTQEGVNKPCYAGSTTFEIVAQRVTPAEIKATIANAQVMVRCSQQFLSYFHDAHFTLTSAAGNEFAFDAESQEPIFIAPGEFTVEGAAFKQTGTEVVFPVQNYEAEARTVHTVLFDLTTAGTATVTIKLDDTLVDELPIDTELNPES